MNRKFKRTEVFVTLITTIQKFGVSKNFYFIFGGNKLENTFIHQAWVKLIKRYSKDIYNVRKDYILNKWLYGKCYTTVFNFENNNLCFLSIKSAY